MKDSLLDIITYEEKPFSRCTVQEKGIIIAISNKLQHLETMVLNQAEACIDISANRIKIDGLTASLKTKVLDQIYKK